MTENKEKPYLSVAALCEHALIEKDDVISGIRFVNKLIVTAHSGADPSSEMIHLATQLSILISFKSGPARGKRTVGLRLYNPKGEQFAKLPSFEVDFKGEEHGVNLIIQAAMPTKDEGLYWFDVTLDDEVITRIPLIVEHVREPK